MREQSKDPWRVKHILEAIGRIERYVRNKDYEDFNKEDILYYAVVKNIEIIGEAANMLTKEFKDCNAEIPWKAVCGMRNYIVHEYFAVDSEVVWQVVSNDLPVLKNYLMNLKL